jgi:hypothetical protein
MGSALQDNRLDADRGLKTAKHQKQQKHFHGFACHIDTSADCCAFLGDSLSPQESAKARPAFCSRSNSGKNC